MYCGFIGFTANFEIRTSANSCLLHTHRSPLGLTREGHSSSWPHPFRVSSPEPLRDNPVIAELPTVVFFPHRVTYPVSSTPHETSQVSLRSTLELFQLLGGFLRIRPTQACFILRPRPGFSLRSGTSPFVQPHFLVESALSPLPFVASSLRAAERHSSIRFVRL